MSSEIDTIKLAMRALEDIKKLNLMMTYEQFVYITDIINKSSTRRTVEQYQYATQIKISKNTWNNLAKKQNYKCAICGVDNSLLKRKLAIDHCHTTGKIRGLLCGKCNMGIGYFNDSAELLLAARDYLEGV